MARDYIVHHEDNQRYEDLVTFVQGLWHRRGMGVLPPIANVQNSVPAYINEGRWVAECPVDGCGGAILVSEKTPLFLCPECGSPENGNNWYAVAFPADKAVIERVLLKRPSRVPDRAKTRHWRPGESVDDLKRENRERGLPEG